MAEKKKTGGRAASLANLRANPINKLPEAERKEICRKGAEGARKVKERKRALRDIMQDLLSMEMETSTENLGELQQIANEAANESGRKLTVYETIALAQMAAAAEGSTRAAEFVRDSAGDKPGENLQVQADTMTAADTALLDKVAKRLQDKSADKGE